MLFDTDNFDLNFLSLAGMANNDNDLNLNMSSNTKLESAKNGFLKGNMFTKEYLPYKNYTYIDIVPKNEREAKLYNIMAYSFAINDLDLYLDLHPDDTNMLNTFKELVKEEEKAKKEYEKIYGPLELCHVEGNNFDWIKDPWSWDKDGGVKYV